jgi:hypothetical protein
LLDRFHIVRKMNVAIDEAGRAGAAWPQLAPLRKPTSGPLDGLGVSPGTPLLDTIDAYRLRVCLFPDVWPQRFVVRLPGQESEP